ncbi:hypothetical protein DAEQUDRAFT_732067 [Daedalea quercina L-15889]|uniref:Uncharacterized protein n=1 Tax=Daedalea quercina L-15889 TaxID=1314783 RepID=A0A165LUM3_9APHY|nr:hypothetical protein DAEQUDRAFT_732067 [Daedalea quercina L-15889]
MKEAVNVWIVVDTVRVLMCALEYSDEQRRIRKVAQKRLTLTRYCHALWKRAKLQGSSSGEEATDFTTSVCPSSGCPTAVLVCVTQMLPKTPTSSLPYNIPGGTDDSSERP